MMRYPGGLVRATPRLPTIFAAPGIWTVRDAIQAEAQGIWPTIRNVTVTNTDSPISASVLTTYTFAGASLGAAATGRVIAVFVDTHGSAGSPTVVSVTIGGVSATFRKRAVGSSSVTVELWTAVVPTGTTGDILVTWSAAVNRCGLGVFRIIGAPSDEPYHTNSDAGTGNLSTTVNVLANGAVAAAIGGSRNASAFTTTWSGVTESYDETVSGGTCHSGGCVDLTSAESGRTISATFSAVPDVGAGLIAASW